MIRLVNKDTGTTIGAINEDDLDVLIDTFVEESTEDQDYYINRETLDMLKDNGASASLISMIERAMGGGNDIEIKWERA